MGVLNLAAKLKLTVDKTIILVLSKGSMFKTKFYNNNLFIENVSKFKYLDVVFSRTGSFSEKKSPLRTSTKIQVWNHYKK